METHHGGEYRMKKIKENVTLLINLLLVLITAVFNLYSYFHLPEVIATQLGLRGSKSNMMPKEIYLLGCLIIMGALAFFASKGSKENKIKYTVVNAILFIANIVIIVIQLNN
jgi:uncharacterized membrane protein